MNPAVEAEWERIAKKIGPGIMRNDPIVVGHLAILRTGFATAEDALIGCVRTLSVLNGALHKKVTDLEMYKTPPQLLVVTKERFEELKKEMGT